MSVVIDHKKQKNIPKLRFSEFQGAWEETKLANVINEYKEKSKEQNEYEVFTSARKGIVLQKEYFKEGNRLSSRDNIGFNMLPPDFITYRSRSDDGRFYFNKNTLGSTGIISIYYPVFNSKKNTNLDFLLDTLNINWKTLYKFSVGTSQKVLSLPELKKVKLHFPSESEQQKIDDFLNSVNKWIESSRAQKEKLEVYKKGMMQKIFNQEIRFKDDNGNDFPDWEEKELGGMFKIGSGKDYKHLKKGNIPVFGTGGYMLSVDTPLYTGESVLIGRKGTIDKPFYYNGSFWTVDTLFYTHSFKGVIAKFVDFLFQTINWKKYNEASGVPSLSKLTISKIKTYFPTISEQQKIADFFTSIDNLIKAKQTQIIKAQNWKKGLMQQLFI